MTEALRNIPVNPMNPEGARSPKDLMSGAMPAPDERPNSSMPAPDGNLKRLNDSSNDKRNLRELLEVLKSAENPPAKDAESLPPYVANAAEDPSNPPSAYEDPPPDYEKTESKPVSTLQKVENKMKSLFQLSNLRKVSNSFLWVANKSIGVIGILLSLLKIYEPIAKHWKGSLR